MEHNKFHKRSVKLITYEDNMANETAEKQAERKPLSTGHSLDNAVRALESLVICSICQKRLKSPKMLQCQHTFCLACLEMSYRQQGQQHYITCSTCESKHTFASPSALLTDLPKNVYIDSVLQVLSQPTAGTSVCAHQKQILSASNSTSNYVINDGSSNSTCSKCDTIGSIKMQNCNHCNQVLCAICWQSHMDQLIQQVKQLDVQLNSGCKKMDHKMTDYKIRFKHLNSQIKAHFEEKLQMLEEQERAFLDESQRILNDALCAHELVMEKIRRLKTTIEDNTIGTHGNFVQAFLNLHKEISIVFEEISHWGEEIVLFDQKKIKIEVITAQDGGNEGSLTDVDCNQETQKTGFVKPAVLDTEEAVFTFYKNHTFKPKLFWNKCHRPAGVGVAPWKHETIDHPMLYIAGAESKVVYVVNKNSGEIVQRIVHDDMAYPNGITFDEGKQEIFISDKWKHCVFVFSADGLFLRQICGKGDQEGFLRSPEGIAIGPSGALFICDTGNDRVQCVNPANGRMLSQFGCIPKDQLLKATLTKRPTRYVDLKCPTGVAIHNDKVVVLDSGNRRVKVFNKQGDKILEFGQVGSIVGQFQYPEVIAVDQSGFILVGDGGNAKILIFRPNGSFVTALGCRGEKPGTFNWLSGLYVSKDREIIISDYKNHTVQVIA
ncbi:RING finger protein nhl-1-like [Ochlerotatus camptorhynchus]|uniref:RING finger protein nhl-1-like n=1 Tax=Ochlerotatus camptorhynchus TaxID=644619 RepID=UPI0031D4A470